MKDLLTDALTQKLASTLEAVGGARALFGEPVEFGGETIIPVGRVTVHLSASAEGSGGGQSGFGGLSVLPKGGGGGTAGAGVKVMVEPVGYLRSTPAGPQYVALPPA